MRNRLPFTIAASFHAYKVPADHIEHAITDSDVCWVCGSLIIFASALIGAYLGYYL